MDFKSPETYKELIPDCPIRNVLSRVTGKWSLLVLFTLRNIHPCRFKDLRTSIPDISSKMLTETLRMLEDDGLVSRRVYAEIPPRVEYDLTECGMSLLPVYNTLLTWAKDHMTDILRSRQAQKGE